jgi:signal peptidase I
MKKGIRIILHTLPYFFFTLAVVLIIQIVVSINQNRQPSLFGYSINYVLTPSMEPTILAGDLVLMKNIHPDDLNENDIINFKAVVSNQEQSFTHRIVSIIDTENGRLFTTKGDNNSSSFSWETNMQESQIVSKYISKSTFFGSLYHLIFSGGVNFIYAIAILLFVTIAISEAKNLFREISSYKKKELEKQKNQLIQEEVIRLKEEASKNNNPNTDDPK